MPGDSTWFEKPQSDEPQSAESTWHMSAEVPELIDHYAVDRVISRGPRGIVFKATDPLGLKVAIKWLPKRRDEAELATIVQLSQTVKGMPPVLGSGVLADRTYFVMPYFERRSLRFRLRSMDFPLPLPEIIRLAHACTEVLGELHRHGYTHFDFKPDNLLIEALPTASEHSEFALVRLDERLVLTDFGTTRSTDGEEQFGDGTPGYAAPEVLFKVIDHDPRVDVYAASATLVECMTGVAPTQVRKASDSPFAAGVLDRTGPLAPALRKGLNFNPADRPNTMSRWFDELYDAAAVQQSFSGGPTNAEPGNGGTRPVVSPTAELRPKAGHRSPQALERAGGKKQSALGRTGRRAGSIAASALLILAAFWGISRLAERPSLADESTPESGGEPDAAGAATNVDAVTDVDGVTETDSEVDLEQPRWEEFQADPALMQPKSDPTWGTPRRHLTAVAPDDDGSTQSDGARYHRIDASSRSVLSPNERWVLADRDASWTVVDRSNGNFRSVEIGRTSSPTWDLTEPETILHLADLTLMATTIDGQTTVVADLRAPILAELPEASLLRAPLHGGPSSDGQRFAWAVLDAEERPIGFVVYDRSTNAIIGLRRGLPDGDIGDFGSLAMAKSGEQIVLAFETSYIVYAADFSDEWRIEQAPFDYELALSASGHDVLVVANFDSGTFGYGGIVAHNLTERTSAKLLDLFDNANTNISFSGLAIDKPGWVLASSYNCKAPGAWSCDRIMALNIDDATIVDIAETNSCATSDFTVPRAVVSRDFSRAWFNTDYGSCGEDATIVELEIGEFLE